MKTSLASILIFTALLVSATLADDIGWRGDGSGVFPDSHPPTTWSRATLTVLGRLRCAAQRPPGNVVAGDPVPPQIGSMSHWLVLGPFAAGDDPAKALAATPIREDANLNPKAGDATGGLQWKTLDTLSLRKWI